MNAYALLEWRLLSTTGHQLFSMLSSHFAYFHDIKHLLPIKITLAPVAQVETVNDNVHAALRIWRV